ncbi:hypothetical protein AB0395_47400 [Streptosporangium sp. NPDC051023]|uniref:hypothetical protein n=1 Tax=Streptosporangium sp. NPDC051023 TaxID=3155410 RepID=UPI00344BF030
MIGRSRHCGRHRDGQPLTKVYRRLWDGPARSEAEQLDRSCQSWSVLYSLGQRRFYALAAWPTPEPLIIADDTAEGLAERMREAETAFIRHALPAPASLPDRRDGARSQAPAVAPQHGRRPYREAA